MSDDFVIYVEDPVDLIEVGSQGAQGPTGPSGSSGSIETKTANFNAASSGLVAYRCKGTITATLPTFATADSNVLLEFKAVGTSGDAITISGDANIDGSANTLLAYREVIRVRKGETEWEVWG